MQECEADKKNATLCHRCLFKHENQTRNAHCTYVEANILLINRGPISK